MGIAKIVIRAGATMHLFCRQRAGRWSARRMWFGGQNSLKAHCDVSSVPALGSRPRQRSIRDVKDGSDDSSSSPFDEAFPRNAFRPHSKRVRTKPSTHRVHSDSNYPGYVVLYRGFVLTSTPPKQGGFGGHPQSFARISAQSCDPRRDCNIRSAAGIFEGAFKSAVMTKSCCTWRGGTMLRVTTTSCCV